MNPSVTSPRAGDRSHRQNRNPRDLTGKEYLRQHAEQDARTAAASEVIDLAAIKRHAFLDGFSQGWDQALAWVIDRMTEAGLDPDTLVAGDPGDHDEDQADEAGD